MELHQLNARTTSPVTGSVPLCAAFHTLGCRLNQVDTQALKTAISGLYDLQVVPWHEPAQLYILNSCTVTTKADQECRRLARQIKRRHPAAKVVVVGCYAQTQPEALGRMPEIDGVIGNADKDDVVKWLPAVLGSDLPQVRVRDFAPHPVFDAPLIDEFPGRSRAFVKVQDGCNLRCSYCLIWRARGPSRSRSQSGVVAQLQRLAARGYGEVVLTGVHLGGYGHGLKPSGPAEPRPGLVSLLRECLTALPDLRLRLGSIHPNEVTAGLLALFAEFPQLRPHLHISLQSGSSSVLRRMKRPYRRERAVAAVESAAALAAGFGLGADLIVGFPGETEDEFEDTRRLVADLPFSYLHVFRFSQRPGTAAADLPDQVSAAIMGERSGILRSLAEAKRRSFERKLIGSTREAVVEAESADGDWRQATTDNYASVLVPREQGPPGVLGDVTVIGSRRGQLHGTFEPRSQDGRIAGQGA